MCWRATPTQFFLCFLCAVCVLALPLLLLSAAPASAGSSDKALETAMSQDGLRKTSVKGIDLVYVKPGAKVTTEAEATDPVLGKVEAIPSAVASDLTTELTRA